MALTKAHFRMIAGQSFNVKDYGAIGDGVANDASAIQAAINAADAAGGGTVYFPSGDYKTDAQVTLCSDLELRGDMNAHLLPSVSVATQAYYANGKANIRVTDLVFEGTGAAFSTGTERLLQFDTCSEVQVHNCTFRKAREGGLVADNCDQGRLSECLFEQCHQTGATIRNGCVSWVVSDCLFYLNGNTGIATSANGRGIVVWESARVNISNCTFKDNTEYGLRFYSQAGDSDYNQQCAVSNCTFENNGTTATGKVDFYIYNEIQTMETFVVSNCTFRTASGRVSMAIQGNGIAVSNCSFDAITAGEGFVFNLFEATNVTISNCVARGFDNCFSISSTAGSIPNNINVINCQFIDCDAGTSGIYGENTVISNCYFKQSAAAKAANVSFIVADDVGSTGTKIINNTFDNCYRGLEINIDNCDIEISGNLFVNTGDFSVRCYGTDLTNLIWHTNKLDLGTNPAILGKIQRMGCIFPMVVGKSDVAPTVLTFAVGDMVFNSGATAGGKAGWICTTAGTPGTWKPFGAIDA
jgi:parallel beta-helix repeat protein